MKVAFALMAFMLAATVSACNTVEGVGKDTQKAGQAIEHTADDAKH
jgi:entericidin B